MARTFTKKVSTRFSNSEDCCDSDCAANSTELELRPVSSAAWVTPEMLDDTSRVAADCSSTAPEIEALISLTWVMVLTMS